jgi:uncharacterized membrane protein
MHGWLVLIHVLAAMVWLGSVTTVTVLAAHALRRKESEAIERFLQGLETVGGAALGPSAIAVLASGIWLVAASHKWGFAQAWVIASLVLFTVASVAGALIQGRAAKAANKAVAAGDHTEAGRQVRRWSWGMRVMLALLVVATWDMVFKPGI